MLTVDMNLSIWCSYLMYVGLLLTIGIWDIMDVYKCSIMHNSLYSALLFFDYIT